MDLFRGALTEDDLCVFTVEELLDFAKTSIMEAISLTYREKG